MKKAAQKQGKSVNGRTKVVGIRLLHAAVEELTKRAEKKRYPDLGSYLRALLEEFALRAGKTPATSKPTKIGE